jgi:hypothetical protein
VGYFPRIASINNYPVYIENRNGNSNVKYKQAETLKRAYLVNEYSFRNRRSRFSSMVEWTLLSTEEGYMLIKVDNDKNCSWEYVDYGWELIK